jgi:DNA polymerase III delta prime subunit
MLEETRLPRNLLYFHATQSVPHILFHGPYNSVKEAIISDFIQLLYENNETHIRNCVMYVNCDWNKGIKFIRDELTPFVRTTVHANSACKFKTVVLQNCHSLSMESQSALRRCIEVYSATTRFFFVTPHKTKLLQPILSRLCEIYVSNEGKGKKEKEEEKETLVQLKKQLFPKKRTRAAQEKQKKTTEDILLLSTELYERAYCAQDVVELLSLNPSPATTAFLFSFEKTKLACRSEKMLLFHVLHFMFG